MRIKCYTVERPDTGRAYVLDPPTDHAEPLELICDPEVATRRSASGEMLLYRGKGVYGQTVRGALECGWCRLSPAPDTPDAR